MSGATEPRIVVGLDGSPASLAALRWALDFAARVGAPVEVVHCRQSHLHELLLGPSEELHRGSICMLQNEVAAAKAGIPGPVEVRETSTYGIPARELCRIAADAQMLVLGVHGHPTLRDIAFGRVASSCLRHASCLVVVVNAEGYVVHRTAPGHRPDVPASAARDR